MSALSVPQQQTSSTVNRSGPASALRPIEHNDDLAPVSRSRRNSASNTGLTPLPLTTATAGAPGSAAAQAGLVPLPSGPIQATAENNALIAPVDWKEPDQLASADGKTSLTTLYVGKNRKPAHIPTAILKGKSPYFRRALADDSKTPSMEQTSFDDIDEFGMALFMHWLSDHGRLRGPHDFHSLAHYLSLYVLAKKFEVEELENQTIDLIRHYYALHNMTAPAYRLEYIYTYTHEPNKMRELMVSTAAYRALEDSHAPPNLSNAGPLMHQTFYASGSYVSDSIKGALFKNPEMAMDFVEALVKLHRCGEHDPRAGPDCDWHVHDQTSRCRTELAEPWQKDGAGDEKPAADKKPDAPKKEDPKPADKPKEERESTTHPTATSASTTTTTTHDPLTSAHWRSETHRLQWEMTERALAKNDDGVFKKMGSKMKGHMVNAKEKMHSKKDKSAKNAAHPEKKDAQPKDDKDKAPAAPPAKT